MLTQRVIIIGHLIRTFFLIISLVTSVCADASDLVIDHRAISVLRGTITHVRDGDTFEVNGTPVRISALDCAENTTDEGKKITRFAKQFKGKEAICELTGATTYDRVVGYCSINGVDFGKMMMDETSCNLWAKYDVWDRYQTEED